MLKVQENYTLTCTVSFMVTLTGFFFVQNEGGAHKRKGGGERRDPSTTAKTHLQWKTDVSFSVIS